ncbi:glycosyl hydrolase family 28-related protein [Streptomyces sp. UNOB3_S3]|uniref:glycosyl hydrolase family 28-related protein n=1 Tax=Streptomyces sp. UNOB3_S3 TaxID=2871682 RepID=UPI001E609E7A|nr:glycosyl hydrolase family 28-related protein [Streptomyces sp. UNOB3_S3]MCC3774895.1 hypothetical protein [Streptomyces sp. UNOB3_S3]
MQTATVAVAVAAGDVLCPALDPADPAKLTKATHAALTAGTAVVGVAAQAAAAGSRVSYFAADAPVFEDRLVPSATTGLGLGLPAAVVVDDSARAVRRVPAPADAWIVGHCDAQGVLTLAPHHGFANVLDFGATGDGGTDDWAAINAAMNSLKPASGTGTGTGTLYFPPGTYNIARPLFVSGFPGIELLGENRVTSTIRLNSAFGPALCICPAEVGHFPTGDALLSGSGKAGVLRKGRVNTLDFRDCPALDSMNGLPAFSVECTVRVDDGPRDVTSVVLSSSGRRTTRDPDHTAFSVYLVDTGAAKLAVSATCRIGGQDVTARLDEAVPVGVTMHIALTYDGTALRLFTGAPGAPPQQMRLAEVAASGPLNQAIEEGVYLGVDSISGWPEFQPSTLPFPGRIDSIRISGRATRTAPFTAPTAKFPTDDASNQGTLLLINFDRDVDVFTVGYTWKDRPPGSGPVLVYLLHRFDRIPGYSSPVVRSLGFQSSGGAGIQGQLALNAVLDRVTVSAARDGIRFRNNSYLAEFEHIDIGAGRLGLQLSGNTALVNVKRLQTHGTQYDFVATDVVGVFARDWYIGTPNSIVPVLLTSQASFGSFHGVGLAISSEGFPSQGPKDRWQTAVLTASLTSLVLESSTLQTPDPDPTERPCVIVDSSLNRLAGPTPECNYTFVNCDFQLSPNAKSVFVLSGETAPHPVRIIGSRKATPATVPAPIPWTLPHQSPFVSFVGGSVSTTDTGLTQWQGTRDWVFAYDPATGRTQAGERESQTTGQVPAGGTVDLSTAPLTEGATVIRAEAAATSASGQAARWTIEQGFTTRGTTTTPWSTATRILDAFGSTGGAPPPDWRTPTIELSNDRTRAVVRCTAPAGQNLTFTVRLRTLDALAAAP